MKPEEQRIAIAKACGWNHWFNGWNKLEDNTPPLTLTQDLPDYLNDLNAMHEVEKILKHGNGIYQHTTYRECLNIIVGQNGRAWHATAAQRAEAFLRTLGKWKD